MGQAMIILEFPDPENPLAMGVFVAQAQRAFEGTPNMRMHLAVRGAVEEILAIVKPPKIEPKKLDLNNKTNNTKDQT